MVLLQLDRNVADRKTTESSGRASDRAALNPSRDVGISMRLPPDSMAARLNAAQCTVLATTRHLGGPDAAHPRANHDASWKLRPQLARRQSAPAHSPVPCIVQRRRNRAAAAPAAIPGVQFATGAKFGDVRVAETNAIDNPTFTFLVDGPGGTRTIVVADPAILLTPRLESEQMSALIPGSAHRATLSWGVLLSHIFQGTAIDNTMGGAP
jgi:hypothetical protein